MVANEGGKHRTTPEVWALIGIWSEKTIQQQLEVRHEKTSEQTASRLQKTGIERLRAVQNKVRKSETRIQGCESSRGLARHD